MRIFSERTLMTCTKESNPEQLTFQASTTNITLRFTNIEIFILL